MEFKDHDLTPAAASAHDAQASEARVDYDTHAIMSADGQVVEGLHTVWITLNNPQRYNSYTTEMVKQVILGMRRASNDRACVAVVLTGAGEKAFCTGGNIADYASYYAGKPEEYRQYLRLFVDMITSILHCDKPVINRVNGMRIGGGQELGLACDYSIAQDLALFGQAGPQHGSAPDGGSTDFLALFVGIEAAMESCTLGEFWSAHKAQRLGLLTQIVPALKVDGEYVPNPMVRLDRWTDDFGQVVHGEPKTGDERKAAKEPMRSGQTDLRLLDEAVDALVNKLLVTFPGCLMKTIESVRKHKLAHWDRNRETNRSWLALNMMTEGRAGFRAFHEGSRDCRDADFVLLRRLLAEGRTWDDELTEEILAKAHGKQ
ncbi:MAG: 6-oxo-cyclohex-1-ene-carbonyl-CoA hydrolase [Candidatus Paceibacteria bacterium]|jgi:6-oxo-cyclohex-1-ene-carbonyl-CoA hydrolase